MFFIYSLNLTDNVLELHEFCQNESDVSKLLDQAACNFIRVEEGERRIESAYKDTTPDSQITTDGYFLRHSDKPNQIDVYLRKTAVSGKYWVTCDITCKKVLYFGVTEANFDISSSSNTAKLLPVPKKNNSSTNPTSDALREEHLKLLKERVDKRRLQVDAAIKDAAIKEETDSSTTENIIEQVDDLLKSLKVTEKSSEDWLKFQEQDIDWLDTHTRGLEFAEFEESIYSQLPSFPPTPPPCPCKRGF